MLADKEASLSKLQNNNITQHLISAIKAGLVQNSTDSAQIMQPQ